MVTDTALWQAINAYELDDADAAFPFSQRLARDTGWSHKRALAAIAEYKRFIYLVCHTIQAQTGTTQPGTVLTPSEDVDEAWHLHLIYTRDYWDRLCDQTLGRKIHHGPTQGGAQEDSRYMDCYRRTLEVYEKEFGPPPANVWPDPTSRFQPSPIRRTDLSETIALPKRQVFLCLAAAAPLALAGCAFSKALVFDSANTDAITSGVFAFVGLVCLVLNLSKIREWVSFIVLALFLSTAAGLWLGHPFNRILGDFSHHHLSAALGYGAAALIGFLLVIRICTLPPGKGGRNGGSSGCGGGCSGSGGCSGHSGCGGSGCGSSGCGGGCGGH